MKDTSILAGIRRQSWAVREWIRIWRLKNVPDAATRRFRAANRRKFLRDWTPRGNPVVLVEAYETKPALFCFAYVANALARRTRAAIETFTFKARNPVIESVYASFGAKPGLSLVTADPDRAELAREADRIFASLSSKWDVVNLAVDDIVIGDLIYDHYLRYEFRPTVDIRDPRLRKSILQALTIFRACQKYFAEKTVVAVLPDHTRYLKCGIIVRLATLKGIPVFLVEYRPIFYLFALESGVEERIGQTGRLQSFQQGHPKRRWPYRRYRELFERLSPTEQEAGRARGRQALRERLSGKIDNVILEGISAYGQGNAKPIFAPTSKPRVLLLLNDFVDSVHKFRDMLFPDYYEYANFVLDRASQTDCEWFAKPHPNSLISPRKNRFNKTVVDELKRKYPKITFLDPGVSNRQMVSEGIAAVFTAHGTAGHEFAYMGVPVVNAGDNLHVAYDFNLHSRNLEEFAHYVDTAGALQHPIDLLQVEEFFYMHNFYFYERNLAHVNPIPPSLLTAPDYAQRSGNSAVYEEIAAWMSPDRERELEDYLSRFFTTDAEARKRGSTTVVAV